MCCSTTTINSSLIDRNIITVIVVSGGTQNWRQNLRCFMCQDADNCPDKKNDRMVTSAHSGSVQSRFCTFVHIAHLEVRLTSVQLVSGLMKNLMIKDLTLEPKVNDFQLIFKN